MAHTLGAVVLHTRALLFLRLGEVWGGHRQHAASNKAAKVIVPPGMLVPAPKWRKCETVHSFQRFNLRSMRPLLLLS